MGMKIVSGNRINNVLDVAKHSKHRQTSDICAIPFNQRASPNDQVGMMKSLNVAVLTVGMIMSIRPFGWSDLVTEISLHCLGILHIRQQKTVPSTANIHCLPRTKSLGHNHLWLTTMNIVNICMN